MSSFPLKRNGDYADMPRQLAWFVITVKEVGMPVVVIGALLYICFVSFEKLTVALNSVTAVMVKLDANEQSIINDQRIILERIR